MGHSSVPDRPLGEGGMATDRCVLALGPWGRACPGGARAPSRPFHPEGVLSWASALLPSQASRGAFGRGVGVSGPLFHGHCCNPPREAQHCPPRFPRGTASLQACSPTSWKSRSAGEVLVGAHFITEEKGLGKAGEQGGGGGGDSRVGGAEQRARQGGLLPVL